MAYHYENIRLEKGMYGRSGQSFAKTLEELDPSEHYRGTPLEGLDAFQRQLKRFDIKVKGAGSDMVEKFFHTTESSVLFPEFVSRVVRQGLEEGSILPDLVATVTHFDGMDYRSIASVPTEEDKKLRRVEEGAAIPETVVRTQENLVRLHKRGRMLVASYEAIRFQRLDLFSVTLRQIGAYIGRMHLEDAIGVILNGDGNDNKAKSYSVGTKPVSGTAGTLSYEALVDFWSQFDPYDREGRPVPPGGIYPRTEYLGRNAVHGRVPDPQIPGGGKDGDAAASRELSGLSGRYGAAGTFPDGTVGHLPGGGGGEHFFH